MRKSKILIFVLVLLLLLTVSCTQEPVKGAESSIFEEGTVKNIKITDNNVNIREGCSNNTNVLQACNKNDTYNVLSKVADWYAVKLPNNTIGFIPEQQCKAIVVDKNKTNITPDTRMEPDLTPGYTPDTNLTPDYTPDTDLTPGYTPDTDLTPGYTPDTDLTPGYTPDTDLTPGYTPDAGMEPGITPDYTPDTDTGYSESNNNVLTNQEQEMLRLVNEARTQNNVAPLAIDMELTEVARLKSQDMIDNNYFSHNSPTYGSPFDMMNDFGIEYVHAGENIAGNQNVQSAHDALMKSPGHRENILNPNFTHIGIGIKKGSQYGNIFTQMFISKPK